MGGCKGMDMANSNTQVGCGIYLLFILILKSWYCAMTTSPTSLHHQHQHEPTSTDTRWDGSMFLYCLLQIQTQIKTNQTTSPFFLISVVQFFIFFHSLCVYTPLCIWLLVIINLWFSSTMCFYPVFLLSPQLVMAYGHPSLSLILLEV